MYGTLLKSPCTNSSADGTKAVVSNIPVAKSILEQNRDVIKHYMKAYTAFSKLYNNDVIYSANTVSVYHTLESVQDIEKTFITALEHNADPANSMSIVGMYTANSYTADSEFNFDKEEVVAILSEFAFVENNGNTGYAYLMYEPLVDHFSVSFEDLLAEDEYANILCKDNILTQTLLKSTLTSKQFYELLKQVKEK